MKGNRCQSVVAPAKLQALLLAAAAILAAAAAILALAAAAVPQLAAAAVPHLAAAPVLSLAAAAYRLLLAILQTLHLAAQPPPALLQATVLATPTAAPAARAIDRQSICNQ